MHQMKSNMPHLQPSTYWPDVTTGAAPDTYKYKAEPVPCHFKEGPASDPAKLGYSDVQCRLQLPAML